ncbi:MAG: hypothetical protein Tsb0015_01420 [Simkaniaceae bacterium]
MKKETKEGFILNFYQTDLEDTSAIPLFGAAIKAGFPSPADDHIENALDLNALLIKHPAATFFVRAEGQSMENALIQNGDILVVDRAVPPSHGKIVIAILNGEFTVKRIAVKGKQVTLMSENDEFSPIVVEENTDFQIWGVVTYIIHQAK